MISQHSSLRQILLDFPNQFKKSLLVAKDVKVVGAFDKLVVCGMGGSALPADILKAYLESKKIYLPIYVSHDYHLPWQADIKSLVFISSYSGNTEETLSCYQEAKKRRLKIASFAKGGKLLEWCQRDRMPFVQYPEEIKDFQPRLALGYAFGAMLAVLINSKLIPDLSPDLKKMIVSLQPKKFESLGQQLARKSQGLIPIFYTSSRYGESAARVCKIQINETSKSQAFWNVFPEMNHNEMVGFTKLISKYHLIFFEDVKDEPAVLRRMKITAELLVKKGLIVSEIKMDGQTFLEKIFNTIMVGAWFSYYLALAYGQDPLPVRMVEEFKKKL